MFYRKVFKFGIPILKITKELFLEHQRICSFWGLLCWMLENRRVKWGHLDQHPSSKFGHQFQSWGEVCIEEFGFFGEFDIKDKHKCYFRLYFSFLTNLKSGLCPSGNNLLCCLASLSLSRMEGIPHQVINLDFALLYKVRLQFLSNPQL